MLWHFADRVGDWRPGRLVGRIPPTFSKINVLPTTRFTHQIDLDPTLVLVVFLVFDISAVQTIVEDTRTLKERKTRKQKQENKTTKPQNNETEITHSTKTTKEKQKWNFGCNF